MGKLILFIFSCFIWQMTIASAGELEKGIQFFEQENYVKAKELWQPLANKGDARAQYNLALLLVKELNKSENGSPTINNLQIQEANQYIIMSRSKGLVDGYFLTMPVPKHERSPEPVIALSESMVWLNQQQKTTYTLQLATGRSQKSMEVMQKKLFSSESLQQPDNLFIHKVDKKVRDKYIVQYVLIYGVFKTYQDAKNESGKLPESIQKSNPWIRQMGVIQSIVNSKRENKKT